MIITFGKYKGTELVNIPTNYLEWGIDKLETPKWRKLFLEELKRRNQEEADFQSKVANDPDNEELKKQLYQRFWDEYEKEVTDSDCPHEYDQYDPTKEIEERVNNYIFIAITDKKEAELKNEYSEKLEGMNNLDKILSYYHADNLTQALFSTPERYKIALEFCQKLDTLFSDDYWDANV